MILLSVIYLNCSVTNKTNCSDARLHFKEMQGSVDRFV